MVAEIEDCDLHAKLTYFTLGFDLHVSGCVLCRLLRCCLIYQCLQQIGNRNDIPQVHLFRENQRKLMDSQNRC